MGLISMTGFGDGEAIVLGRRTRVEIRSVNHRYLEIRCRLPRSLACLEPQLVAEIKARLQRGKVDVSVTAEEAADGEVFGAVVDASLARVYWDKILATARTLDFAPPAADIRLLLGLPEVVRVAEPHVDGEAAYKELAPALAGALDRLCASRSAEGASLAQDLQRRAVVLKELVERVRSRAPQVQRYHQQRLRDRVTRLLETAGGGRIDENRMAQELALLLDRLDIEEELTRLDHHLRSLGGLLAGSETGPLGRRLDFLVQELMREANTIGSKANDAPIADVVVSIKTELERIREQVQNLE